MPPATPWQGPIHHSFAADAARTESTNDRRVAHFSAQRGSGVTSGPFGMSAPGRRVARNGRPSHFRAISGSHGASVSAANPLVQTFDVLLIPYSVSEITVLILCIFDQVFQLFNRTSDAHDAFCGTFYLYAAKIPRLQRRLAEYNLAFSVTVTVTDETQAVWTQVGDQVFSHLGQHGLHLERYPTSFMPPGDRKYTEEGYQFTVPGNNRDSVRKLKPVEKSGRLITIKLLKDIASKVTNPQGQNPLLWLCGWPFVECSFMLLIYIAYKQAPLLRTS